MTLAETVSPHRDARAMRAVLASRFLSAGSSDAVPNHLFKVISTALCHHRRTLRHVVRVQDRLDLRRKPPPASSPCGRPDTLQPDSSPAIGNNLQSTPAVHPGSPHLPITARCLPGYSRSRNHRARSLCSRHSQFVTHRAAEGRLLPGLSPFSAQAELAS